jgi:hypothetical protein
MSEFFGEQIDFTFQTGVQSEEIAPGNWNWAATVFNDPLSLPPRLQAKWSPQLAESNEASLYSDWQTRDTVFGYRLLEPRVAQFKLAIHCYRTGIVKRQRAVSQIRARLASIEKINQAEPNQALRYPGELIASMRREMVEAAEEFEYLRNFTGSIRTLGLVVDRLAEMGEGGNKALPEQLFRLIGLSWKGQTKVKAFRQRFPNLRYHMGQSSSIPLRYTLPGSANVAGLDIMLDEEVANYLIHCLETIASLGSETATTLFDSSSRNQYLNTGWPPALMMLRAVVELFYYCNFELPFTFPTVYLDRDDPERLWVYQEETGQWQGVTDEHPGSRLKRQAAEIASLLISPPAFLNCSNPDELSRYCRPSISEGYGKESGQYQPYLSIGLAHLSCDTRCNLFKFQSGFELCAQLIDQLIKTQPHLIRVFYSESGSLSTLLALAQFEQGTFKNNFKVSPESQLSDVERFALLGRFWRLLGKHRPLALLGHEYAKAIYRGMDAVGEAPPERSSLLSVHLSSVIAQNAFGKSVNQLNNPLGALKLGDQIRLIELLNASWSFTADCFKSLEQVSDDASLGGVLTNIILSPEHEQRLAINTNSKWVNDPQSIWSLIRATAPVAWDFWVRLVNKMPVQAILSSYDTEGTLNYLFQLSADLVRLMLLLESCNPVMAERMTTDAENAGRDLLSTFAPFQHFPLLCESINYYFEPELQHDRWLAFVINFKRHLEELGINLEKTAGGKSQQDILKAAITQLEVQYPETASKPTTPAASIPPGIGLQEEKVSLPAQSIGIHPAIDEATAQNLELICKQIIGPMAFSSDRLPELIVLSRTPGIAEELQFLAQASEQLKGSLDDRLRSLIFSSPSTVRDVSRVLRQCWPDEKPALINDKVKSDLVDYLNKVDQFINYVKQMFGETALFEENARAQFSQAVFGENEKILDFSLYSILGHTFCRLLPDGDGKDGLQELERFIRSRVGDNLSNWHPEILLLGGGRLRCYSGKVALSGGGRHNPCFSDLDGPATARLLWFSLKVRFDSALQIFRNELPGVCFTIEI